MKAKTILALLGIGGAAAVALSARKTKAASKPGSGSPPDNVSVVDGKISALKAGAQIAAGGSYVIVASDAKHWLAVRKIVTRRAKANPQLEYVLVEMELARELAGDKGFDLPSDAWGGVASIRDAQNLMYRYFTGSGDVAAAVEEVEGTVPALEGSIEPLGLPSVGSGLLPTD